MRLDNLPTACRRLVERHLAEWPADAAYVGLLMRNQEFAPSDASYASWLKYNLNGIQRGTTLISALESRIGSLRGMRVLDIGAGGGGFAIALHRHGCAVTAIEIDPVRLEWLETRVRDHAAAVQIFVRPLEKLGLQAEYDLITCDAVLEHVADWRLLVREMLRLKPRWVYMVYPNKLSVFSMLRDPHYSMFLVVFLEGRLRWLQRPYLRLRGVTRDAWVVAIPTLQTMRRFVASVDPGYAVQRWYPPSFAKLDQPETITFRPARLFLRLTSALRIPPHLVQRLIASQRKAHELLVVQH